ncbi:hypothetical protein VNO80_08314 [Phaseolus coccineus]|uniref:non-specific serine/threonine protein kinase n=1 Tax=Phaseolus coccineus TaxID=3886 RepID=A0AAN9RJA9_PHACN
MKPKLILHPSFFFVFFLISTNTPTYLCEDDAHYTNCGNAFTCGTTNLDLRYPFSGGNRHSYCGKEKLTCEGEVPKITINGIKYRILDWKNSTQTVTMARDDYWDSVCVSEYKNNTFDNTQFQYEHQDDDHRNVTLFYCPSDSHHSIPTTEIGIDICRAEYVYSTFVPVPSYAGNCKVVVIPIFQTSASLVLVNKTREALRNGFELKWVGDYGECQKCSDSGGECGVDDGDGEFQCFCVDGSHSASCTDHLACQWCRLTHVDSSPKHHSIGGTGQQLLACGTKGITIVKCSFSFSLLYQAVFFLLKMQLLRGTFFSFLVITITLSQIPTSCADDVHYLKCSSPFHCANLKNLSYPFWGYGRPTYCGHPAFNLQCTGEVATLSFMSESYRVLEVNDSDHRLKLVRTDYWNNICPTVLRNITMDSTFFNYGSDSQNLTLYYDCPSFPQSDSVSPWFNCSVNGTQMINYFVTESMLENSESGEVLGACKSRVVVPILESEAKVLETNSTVENLKAVLDNGFGAEWDANNSLCDECQNSGGHCGYNPSSSEFACYCRDGSFPSTCKKSVRTTSPVVNRISSKNNYDIVLLGTSG